MKPLSTYRRSDFTTAQRAKPRATRGAAALEVALALSLLIALVMGMLDLGYGVFRHHVLTHATRQIARKAIVRGALADQLPSWGPASLSLTAGQGHELTDAVSGSLVGWNLNEVQIDVEWIDGGHDVREGHRVKVTMTAPHRPIMTFIFGNPTINLSATSIMSMAH